MNNKITLAQAETTQVINELLADGSDPDALYLIEHHLSSTDFDLLEKLAIDAFKLGYEATDPEEFLDDDENMILTCDIVSEIPLDADLINQQIAQIIELAEKYGATYDGWGTYFEGDEDEDSDAYDDENENDEVLH